MWVHGQPRQELVFFSKIVWGKNNDTSASWCPRLEGPHRISSGIGQNPENIQKQINEIEVQLHRSDQVIIIPIPAADKGWGRLQFH